MIRPQINQLPGTADLIAAQTKVAGDPAVMRQIASTWRATSHRAADVSSSMVNFINDVDLKWEGDSADAFDTYMRRFPKAGEGLNTAVEACAGSLDSTAKAFEDAKTGIAGLINEVIDGAVTQMTDYMNNHGGENGENYSKAMTSLSSSPTFTGLVSTKTTAAKGHVTKVEESVAATQKTMNAQLPANVQDSGMGFFSAIPDPGGPDFDPGNKPIVWDITPYKDRTQLSGGNG
ncbi:MAG: WXG100 family type VII secretion target, partial [Nonomuraea sp.]|nr:WXG100 family type VII secretion target [Nonomuraea sp.]